MERILHKRCCTHKYVSLLGRAEVDEIIAKHVPHLRSIQILKSGTTVCPKGWYYELCDEYNWAEDRIVIETRDELKGAYMKKLKKVFRI